MDEATRTQLEERRRSLTFAIKRLEDELSDVELQLFRATPLLHTPVKDTPK